MPHPSLSTSRRMRDAGRWQHRLRCWLIAQSLSEAAPITFPAEPSLCRMVLRKLGPSRGGHHRRAA